MKIYTVKRTPAQLRKREADLLEELCDHHGYMFSDRLPERDQTTMMMRRVGGKTKLEIGIVFKIIVPGQGSFGRQITLGRAQKRKAKIAKFEAKAKRGLRRAARRATNGMRPLHKIGPGPTP